ncbi:MAG: type II secretion system F family protein [Campylobacterota bacterium]|nr:type II secretion system F family protein [Campylobacterota bacterium]
MPKYKIIYQYKNKIKNITLEAKNKSELKKLDNYPKNIIDIKEKNKISFNINIEFFPNNKKLIYELFSSLSIMLNSNLTLSQSINILLKTKQDKKIYNILKIIDDSLKNAKNIDIELQKYKNFLGETPILFLKLGIENGNIKESINSLVELLNQENINKEKFQDIIRYPIMLLSSLFVSIIMIFIYVIPNFEYIFKMLDGNLPTPTKALIFLNDIFKNYLYVIFIAIISFIFISYQLYKSNKIYFDKIIIKKIPIISKVVKYYLFFRLFLSISIVIKSKYQFQIAIEHTKNILSNSYLNIKIDEVIKDIKNGLSIALAFEKTKLFDDLTIRLLYVAQESNNYEKVLEDITNYYKVNFNKSIKILSNRLEPIIIFFISLIILWLVLAVMLPIWNLSSVLS